MVYTNLKGRYYFTTVILLAIWPPQLTLAVNCQGINCDLPKDQKNCFIVSPNDMSLPRPTGPKADCCPLWKCTKSNGGFYTFHGLTGAGSEMDGSETVTYLEEMDPRSRDSITSNNLSGRNAGDLSRSLNSGGDVKPKFKNNLVSSSVATGGHDSVAFASSLSDGSNITSHSDLEKLMDMDKAFAEFGINQ